MEVNFLPAITNLLGTKNSSCAKLVCGEYVWTMWLLSYPYISSRKGLFIHDVMILHFDTEQNIHVSSKNYEKWLQPWFGFATPFNMY